MHCGMCLALLFDQSVVYGIYCPRFTVLDLPFQDLLFLSDRLKPIRSKGGRVCRRWNEQDKGVL